MSSENSEQFLEQTKAFIKRRDLLMRIQTTNSFNKQKLLWEDFVHSLSPSEKKMVFLK
jgi:hypothetical protein